MLHFNVPPKYETISISCTVPTTLIPELSKVVAKMTVGHLPTTEPPAQWQQTDIPTFFGAITEDASALLSNMLGTPRKRPRSLSFGA